MRLALKTPTAVADPSIAGVAVKFPPNRYTQDEAISALTEFAGPEFRRFALSSGVEFRNTALPLSRYGQLSSFTEANDAFLEIALDLAEQALLAALDQAKVRPSEIDIVFSTTVTGLTVPSLEGRLATRVGLRQDVKRVPLFGLGCVAGAAGLARVHDYLRGFPDQVAALLAVELCSLTVQRDDHSMANLVASSLFGDGAGVVVAAGADRAPSGPKLLATRSRTYPDTEDVLGWDIGSNGFQIVLSVEVSTIVEKYLGDDVRSFLADHGLTTADVSTWLLHAAGPKVIDAVEDVLDLPADALDRTRNSLRDNGNLSSVSVLDILNSTVADPPPPGSIGLMIAMGPGFSAELVLLRW
ncbi:type III polyketide synthase [Mycobacterium haemophilum]|uniref:Stilbene synthase n=1 Tax=Mycobacterium haemophilum TaxID=29311 RepID=A0A0I9UDY2_9MYCO|nr:3-oxoacyl-[acyl-carrier-protein] synthase III C-terminal domain-containing protein [Mycobacterium haemophilum]KLO26236.1 stilbene synthase [Mycobacterium haemophilum]KLO37802.1 stilbene synthase [Mycobacterium haemophilum]KLO39495.1 stilbene synthase [Mycobacterium haemophilum]KLO55623.1 stilbene synthase [Mycobacterium haemophilum]